VVAGAKPPQDVVQARLIQTIPGSPQVQAALQFKAKVAQRMGPPVQLASAPAGGGQALPDGLKSGIEHLSGSSMDHVRVHYNSPRPAQLQAHAYAQGHHIHLAPGQSQHLPHEAWHVVQQQQGRVKPTTQLQGVAVNDQSGLEREADVMGMRAKGLRSQAAPQPNTIAALRNAPVQRKIVRYNTRANQQLVDQYQAAAKYIAQHVDQITKQAREFALNWPDYLNSNQAKLSLWAQTAKTYYDDPETMPPFIHAQFGYAVETLVNNSLPRSMAGLDLMLQFAEGHTRPDIVLLDGHRQVAWLDITASDSEGHILEKDGAGWATRPYVAEILYDSLRLSEVLSVSNDDMLKALGGYHADKNDLRHTAETESLEDFRNRLIRLKNSKKFSNANTKTKKTMTKDMMNQLGMDLPRRSNNIDAKGAISLAGLYPHQFGLEKERQDSQHAQRFIANRAHEDFSNNLKQYRIEQAKEILQTLSGIKQCPLQELIWKELYHAIKSNKVNENLLLVALAARECLTLSEQAEEECLSASSKAGDHFDIQQLIQRIHLMRHDLPIDLRLNPLKSWHKTMRKRLKELAEAVESLDSSEDESMGEDDEEDMSDDI
jgi:Domain of unknown function (DUF4157)